MPSSLDYLGRSWGVKTRKVWGGAVQCGRGQGNAQQMRTRCEQRTETFGAVRAEDKNFLPATSLLGSDEPESFLSNQSRVRVTSPSSQTQSHLIFFRVRVLTLSSQSRVTKTVDSLQVIGLQALVNVESHEVSHFFYYISYATKWRPTCCKTVPDKLENGAQHADKWLPIG